MGKYLKWGLIGLGGIILIIILIPSDKDPEKKQINQQKEIVSKLPALTSENLQEDQSQVESNQEVKTYIDQMQFEIVNQVDELH